MEQTRSPRAQSDFPLTYIESYGGGKNLVAKFAYDQLKKRGVRRYGSERGVRVCILFGIRQVIIDTTAWRR
jgi:hypothetical protein